MANVKVFADRLTDGQAKNYMPPIFRYGGIKMHLELLFNRKIRPLFTMKAFTAFGYISIDIVENQKESLS
jgi:hypothetical protein